MVRLVLDDCVVSTGWLVEHLSHPAIRIVDASFFLPGSPRNADREFLEGHIPGAVRFDITAMSDENSNVPNMLPDADTFSSRASALGLGDETTIISYDSAGQYSAARVWWSCRTFGHDAVAVLDGGLPKWIDERRPLESGPASPRKGVFNARFNPDFVADANDVLKAVHARNIQIVDARPIERFNGIGPEFRPGLRSGHIPHSKSLPFDEFLRADKTLKPDDEIRSLLSERGISLDRPIIATCGGGITACLLKLSLDRLGAAEVRVYDGAWAEWGARADLPIWTIDGFKNRES